MTMFTIFNTEGKWRAAGFNTFEEALVEAKIKADMERRTFIIKEGFIEECGAEALAIITKEGEVF